LLLRALRVLLARTPVRRLLALLLPRPLLLRALRILLARAPV